MRTGLPSRSTGHAGLWLIWIGGGLLANFFWEMLQMPLYGHFEGGWRRCFLAALGDLALLAILYALMACAAERWVWFDRLYRWRLLLLAALGFLLGLTVELWALSQGRWSYQTSMPRLPLVGAGLAPVLQMTLIPLGLAWGSHLWLARRRSAGKGRPSSG